MKNLIHEIIIAIAIIIAFIGILSSTLGHYCSFEIVKEEKGNFEYTYYNHGNISIRGIYMVKVENGIMQTLTNGEDTTLHFFKDGVRVPSEKIESGWFDDFQPTLKRF